jgi:hypothetical protein
LLPRAALTFHKTKAARIGARLDSLFSSSQIFAASAGDIWQARNQATLLPGCLPSEQANHYSTNP